MIRVLAIDDEPLALKQLEMYVAKVPYLELAASCRDCDEARKALADHDVDAMFIDINMPVISGMDFVRSLADPPLVVFTTAYSEYAVDGFRVNAVDYLLKPFGLEEFREAAEKIKSRCELARAAGPARAEENDDTIFFRTDCKSVRVKVSEIEYVEGMSEYIKVFVKGKPVPIIVLMSLKLLAEKLPSNCFMRVHRSYMVNLKEIREVANDKLVLDGGAVIPVSDSYRRDLKDFTRKASTPW